VKYSILDLLRKYDIDFSKIGDYTYRAFCPFHNDSNKPNLTIYEKTNSFYCFACHKGGGLVEFVSAYENIPKEIALKKLFDDINYDIIEENLKTKEGAKEFNVALLEYYSKKAKNDKRLLSRYYKLFEKAISQLISYDEMIKIVKEISEVANET
jgi:DNA primase